MKLRKGGVGPILVKRYENSIEFSKSEGIVTYLDLMLYYEDKPRIIDIISRLRKYRETMRQNGKKNVKVDKDDRDYPAMICRCCPEKCIDQKLPFVSFFGHAKGNNKKFYRNQQLLNKMNQIGGVGNINESCTYPVGQCAEQHAAQFLLNKVPTCNLNEILYSTPMRPRDNSFHANCNNCKDILGL